MDINEFELTLNQINLLEQLYLHKDTNISEINLMKINATQDNTELTWLRTNGFIKGCDYEVKRLSNDLPKFVDSNYQITITGIAFFENYRYKTNYDKLTIDIANKSNKKSDKANLLSIIAIVISCAAIVTQIVLGLI